MLPTLLHRGEPEARSGWLVSIATLAVFAGVVLAGVLLIWAPHERAQAVASWSVRLDALADNQQRSIEWWLADRKRDAELVASTATATVLGGVQPSPGAPRRNPEAVARTLALLAQLSEARGGAGYLADDAGQLITSTTSETALDPTCRAVAQRVTTTGSTVVDLHVRTDAAPIVCVGVPVRLPQRAATRDVVGVVLLDTEPRTWLYPVLDDAEMTARSAESVLVQRGAGSLVTLSPLRLEPGAPAGRVLDSGLARLVIATRDLADRVVEARDYRGEQVLAVARPISGTSWTLIAKVDLAETLADYRTWLFRTLVLAGVFLVLMTIGGEAVLSSRRAEDRARVAEHRARLGALLDHTHDAILFLDREGTIREVNRSAEETYGLGRDELVGLSLADLAADPSGARASGELTLPVDLAQHVYETEHRRSDGSTFPVEVSTSRGLLDGVESYTQVVRDVSTRRAAERERDEAVAALRASEERFRSIFETVSVAIALTDPDGTFREVNQCMVELLGYPREDLLGTPEVTIRHPEDRDAMRDAVVALRRGAPSVRLDQRLIARDGHVVWCDVSLTAVRGPEGDLRAVMASAVDVTERRLAQQVESKRLRQLGFVNLIARSAASKLEVNELLTAAVTGVHEGFGFDNVALLLVESERGVLGRGAMAGMYADAVPTSFEIPLGRGLTGRAVTTGAPVVVSDVSKDPAYIEAFPDRAATKSEVCIPVKLGAEVLAVLDVQATRIGAFDATDVLTLQTVADQLAVSIQNASLFERLRAELGERTRAEAALRESEARLEAAQSVAGIGSWEVDLARQRMIWSQECFRVLGLEPGTIEPGFDAFLEAVHPDDRLEASALAETVLLDLKPRSCRLRLLGPDQVVRWANLVAEAKPGRDGEAVRLVGTIQNITEAVRAEQAVRERDRLYRTVAGNIPASAVFLFDRNLRFDLAEGPAIEEQGFAREHFEGRTLPETLDEATVALLEPHYRAALTGRSSSGEFQYGSTSFTIRTEPLHDDAGTVVGGVALLQDVTETRQVRSDQAKLGAAVEQATEAIVITGVDGTITYVNPAFERVTGYTRFEAIGQKPSILKSGVHDEAFYREMWQTIMSGQPWIGHMVNRRKDGSTFEEEAVISPVRDDGGRVVSFVAVKRDVTRERQVEDQLRHAQRMEAVGRLAGGIAHDFNNLLQAILVSSEMLSLAAASPAEVKASAAEIAEQVQRGRRLTQQLLLFARRGVSKREPTDLNDVLRGAESLMRRLIRENILISISTTREALPVNLDRGQFDQVLMNLTVNAADAMPDGGRLELIAGREKDEAWFEVVDTGVGMHPKVLDRIFEPFFTTKSADRGTGLGLAVVHGIVGHHGGRVEVKSTVGEGTVFRVSLPLAVDGQGPAKRGSGIDARIARGERERLLVVEDNTQVRTLLCRVLGRLGYEVTAVGSGEEALGLPVDAPFDLLLSDVMLPGMAGPEVAHKLRTRWPTLRVVLMSGYAEDEVLRRDAESGVARFLQKPVDLETLGREVRAALDTSP